MSSLRAESTPTSPGIAPASPDGDSASIRDLARKIRVLRDRVVSEVGRVVVGMEGVTRQFLIALVAGGHVLLEGVPGVAKTTLSKTFARVLGTQYQRIQFTPDLLPSDVTGTYIFDRKANEFVLRKGPDLLPGAPRRRGQPRSRQDAIGPAGSDAGKPGHHRGHDAAAAAAVHGPGDAEPRGAGRRLSTSRGPARSLSAARSHGLSRPAERNRSLALHSDPTAVTEQLFTAEQILDLQWRLAEVHGTDALMEYIVDLAEASRQHPDVALGASPRASLCLLRCARARALLDGRHYFTHEDVMAVTSGVLSHRLIVRPEAEVEGKRASDIVQELLDSVVVLQQ